MKNYSKVIFVFTILLVCGCKDDPKFSPSESGTAGDGNLSAILDQIRIDFKVPALSAMMIVGDSVLEMEAVGDRVFGFTDKVTKNDQWHIGSITKAMTATLAARLVEQGVINWDTTIGEIFADTSIRDAYKEVRLEELFYHTSGVISDITRIASWTGDRENITDIVALRRQWALELLNFEHQIVRGHYLYSNGGYIIAGSMLESVTGKSWELLMDEQIFEPLEMINSGFGSPGVSGKRLQPQGHYKSGNFWIPVDPGPFADNPPPLGPAGTVHTTMTDFAKYLREHVNGANGQDGIVTAESFQKLHTPFPGINYAMGWGTGGTSDNRILAHNGSNTIWFAEVRFEPDNDYAIMVATNAGDTGGQDVIIRGIRIMIERFEKMNQ